MNATFHTGDVLIRHVGGDGIRRFIRIGTTTPEDIAAGRVYVQDCDGAGFLLGNKGRYLLASSLASRYQLHYSPTAERRSA